MLGMASSAAVRIRRGLRYLTYNKKMPTSDVLDSMLKVADETLRTLFAPAHSERTLRLTADSGMTEAEKRHSAGLMRVNHAGEIAAQGLYRGQATLSRSERTSLMKAEVSR